MHLKQGTEDIPPVAPLARRSSPDVDAPARFFDETLGFTPDSVLTMQRRPAIARAFIHLDKAVMARLRLDDRGHCICGKGPAPCAGAV